jgi:hypothetical protein
VLPQFYKQLSVPTEVHVLKVLSLLRRRFFVEFYRGIPHSIQTNFKLYDMDGQMVGETDSPRTNDLCDSSTLFFKTMCR